MYFNMCWFFSKAIYKTIYSQWLPEGKMGPSKDPGASGSLNYSFVL